VLNLERTRTLRDRSTVGALLSHLHFLNKHNRRVSTCAVWPCIPKSASNQFRGNCDADVIDVPRSIKWFGKFGTANP
jgi:hypothetical protein